MFDAAVCKPMENRSSAPAPQSALVFLGSVGVAMGAEQGR